MAAARRRTPVTSEGIPRLELEAILTPLLPRSWRIIPWQDNLGKDTLSTTVVALKQRAIRKVPAAPGSGIHAVEFTVTIATPLTDPAQAEDDLDDSVNALIHAIDKAGLHWEDATKVLATSDTLGYDLIVHVTSYPTTT